MGEGFGEGLGDGLGEGLGEGLPHTPGLLGVGVFGLEFGRDFAGLAARALSRGLLATPGLFTLGVVASSLAGVFGPARTLEGVDALGDNLTIDDFARGVEAGVPKPVEVAPEGLAGFVDAAALNFGVGAFDTIPFGEAFGVLLGGAGSALVVLLERGENIFRIRPPSPLDRGVVVSDGDWGSTNKDRDFGPLQEKYYFKEEPFPTGEWRRACSFGDLESFVATEAKRTTR